MNEAGLYRERSFKFCLPGIASAVVKTMADKSEWGKLVNL